MDMSVQHKGSLTPCSFRVEVPSYGPFPRRSPVQQDLPTKPPHVRPAQCKAKMNWGPMRSSIYGTLA